ncbi:MAG: mechanosensitive ion channel family protein [Nanoarchaeota archaeon]
MVLKEILEQQYLQNTYVHSVLLVLFFYVLAQFVSFALRSYMKNVTFKTKTRVDDLILKRIHRPLFYLLIILGLKIGVTRLITSIQLSTIADHLFDISIAFFIMYGLYAIVNIILTEWGDRFAKKTETTIDRDLLPLFHKSVKIVFILLAVFFVLHELRIDITGLLAGVGIAGLVLGLALKDSLANIFGGISIILDKAFRVDDVIKTSDGDMGTVIDIGLRSTRVKTWDNELLIIPNGQLANAKIQNFKQPDESTRAVIPFGVTYGTSIDKVKGVVAKALITLPNILTTGNKKPKVYFIGFGDSALNLQATFWVDQYMKKFSTKEKAACLMYEALNKHKIDIAFPTRTIYVHNATTEKTRKKQ